MHNKITSNISISASKLPNKNNPLKQESGSHNTRKARDEKANRHSTIVGEKNA